MIFEKKFDNTHTCISLFYQKLSLLIVSLLKNYGHFQPNYHNDIRKFFSLQFILSFHRIWIQYEYDLHTYYLTRETINRSMVTIHVVVL